MLIFRVIQEMQYIHELLCLKGKVEKVKFKETSVMQ